MKNSACTLSLLVLLLLGAGQQGANAQDKLGIGVIVGAPTAVSAQARYPSSNSLDFLFAWRMDNWFFLQCHYDYRIRTLEQGQEYNIGLYAGPGIFLQTARRNDPVVGFSGNVGIAWLFKRHFEFFLEISPKIGLVPSTDLMMTGGFGFRYVL